MPAAVPQQSLAHRPWWRTHARLLVVLGIVVAVVVAVVVVVIVTREPDPVDEPVTASTLDGYPARGSLVGTDDLQGEVDAAADAWRHEDVGGQEEPPVRDQPLEVLWAGDIPAADLKFEFRYELMLDDGAAGRLVTLVSGDDHVATFLAPVDADGDRAGGFRITADSDDDSLGLLGAIGLGTGLTLFSDSTPDTLDVAFPYGRAEEPTPVVATVETVDGLALDPDPGAIRQDSILAGQAGGDRPGLLFLGGGGVLTKDPEPLWSGLTDTKDAPMTWSALREAYAGTEGHRPLYQPAQAELWDGPVLSDGEKPTVVAVNGGGDFPERSGWWEIDSSLDISDVGDNSVSRAEDWRSAVAVTRLGGGTVAPVSFSAPAVPPLVAAWPAQWSELVVVGPPEITSIDILSATGPVHVDGSAAVWQIPDPSEWVTDGAGTDDIGPTEHPNVVVVGHTADGTPVSPLTD